MIPNYKTKLFFSFSSNPGTTGSLLHNTGYKLKKLNSIYIPIKAKHISDVINYTKINNLSGFSLSMPFKEKICKYLHKQDYSVRLTGSCNTVLIKNNKLIGYNTDFIAILKVLKKFNITNKEFLLIGNGAMAKNFYICLNMLKAKKVNLSSRRLERYKNWTIYKNKTSIINWKGKKNIKADILINATPIGMNHIKKKYLFTIKNYKYFKYYIDSVVKKNDIFKSKDFKSHFYKYVSGTELSLYQGLEQFFIYTGQKISFNNMKQKLNYKF